MVEEFFITILPHVPFLLAIGLAAGFLAGLLGIGGGVVLVPFLFAGFAWLDYPDEHLMHMAVATSFAANVPTAISSVRAHWKKEAVRVDIVAKIAPGLLIGVFTATYIAGRLTSENLQLVFAVCVLVMALSMVARPEKLTWRDGLPPWPLSAVFGSVIGGLAALMGIGGAIMTVPFMQMCRVPMHKAVGTAAALGFIIALPALLGYIWIGRDAAGLPPFSFGYVNVTAWAVIVPASVMAAPLGVALAHRLSVGRLRQIFALYLVIVAVRMLAGVLNGG